MDETSEKKVFSPEQIVVRKAPSTPRSFEEIQVDSLVYLKLPGWNNSHRGIVKKVFSDRTINVELRNGTLAERVPLTFLVFK